MAGPTFPAIARPASLLDAWAPAGRVPHAVLALARPGRPLLVESRGAYGPGTPVLVASLSKAVTGAAVLALVEDGRLSPGDRLGTVLAGTFRRLGRPRDPRWLEITVADLARHASGLPGGGPDDPVSPSALAPLRTRKGAGIDDALRPALAAPVGEPGAFAYSNLGYLVLGHVVEAASGKPYAGFAAERLLGPLGIRGALVDAEWAVTAPFGGWRFAAADYLRFLEVFRPSGGILSAATLALAEAEPRYGYGRFRDAGRGAWHHTGSWGPRAAFEQRGDTSWFLAFAADGLPAAERNRLRGTLMERLRAEADA